MRPRGTLPNVTSVHDGHHQAEIRLGLEGIGQGHDEPAVNFGEDLLLHHRTLWSG